MECQYDKVPRPRGDASDTGAHHICQPAFQLFLDGLELLRELYLARWNPTLGLGFEKAKGD